MKIVYMWTAIEETNIKAILADMNTKRERERESSVMTSARPQFIWNAGRAKHITTILSPRYRWPR